MAWSDVGYSLGFKMDMQLENVTKSVGTSYLTPSAQVLFSTAIQENCTNSKKVSETCNGLSMVKQISHAIWRAAFPFFNSILTNLTY